MKTPRDVSANDLVTALSHLGYEITRQRGSHIRLTTQHGGEHHITIPAHNPIKIKTLNSILKSIAGHHHLSMEELLRVLEIH